MILIGIVLLFVLFIVGTAVLLGVGSARQTKWGINLTRIRCPRCGTPAGGVRKPKSMQQALWGGSTCAACGCEFNKWGKAVAPPK